MMCGKFKAKAALECKGVIETIGYATIISAIIRKVPFNKKLFVVQCSTSLYAS